MSIKNTFRKLASLFRIIHLVYKLRPFQAVTRDILFIVTTFIEMWAITLGGQFIDATARLLTSWNTFSLTEYVYTESAYFLLLGLGLWMLAKAFDTLSEYLMEDISHNAKFEMQGDLLEVISRSNLEDVETKEFRDLLTFVPSFSYENVVATYREFSYALKSLLRFASALYILIPYVGYSALIIPLLALPENLAAHYQRSKRRKYNDKMVENLKKNSYLETLMTRLQYFAELRVDNSFSSLKKKYADNARTYMNGLLHNSRHFYIDTRLFATTGRLTMMAYVVYSLAYSVANRLSIGHFKAIYDYVVTTYESSYDFLWSVFRISSYLDYAERYFELLDYEGFGERLHGDKKTKEGTPLLEIKDLTYLYPDSGKKALNDINLQVEPGKYVAIVGADGSGKSSLVRILCGLYQIVDGDYFIDGISIRELDRGELKKHISVVFQDFVNYNLTLKENITLTSEHERVNKELYANAAEVAGIEEMLELEQIKDTQVLGKYFAKGREISPGYWQRLAIARAVYRNKNIFLLDEPFLYIDEKSRGRILKRLMNYLDHKKTLIYVTQEEDFLDQFDEVYDIKGGVLVKRRSK